MPTYSKAISKELNALFDTVEKQTLEYAQAFSFLKNRIEEFDRKTNELDNYRDFFSNNFTNLAAETKLNVNTLITELQENLDKVLELHKEYQQIVEYKDSLILMHNQMRMVISQNDLNQREFKRKSDNEVMNFISNAKTKLDREINTAYTNADNKIDAKFKVFETQLLRLEQKSNAEDNNIRKELDSLKAELTNHKSQYKSVKSNNEALFAPDGKLEEISSQIAELSDEMRAIDNDIEQIDALKKEVSNLKTNFTKNINALKEIGQSGDNSKILNIIALIISIIAIVIAII